SERLSDLLRERDIFVRATQQLTVPPEPGQIALVQGALSEGWILKSGSGRSEPEAAPDSILHTLSDAEIFGWSRPKPRRISTPTARPQSPEAFFADLAVGDHVVHIDHGIGIFRGLQKMDLGGPEREYLLVEYAHGDRLYVPVHQIDRLSRYVA